MRRIPPIPPDLADSQQARQFVLEILAVQTRTTIEDLDPGADLPTTVAKVNEILALLRDSGVAKE